MKNYSFENIRVLVGDPNREVRDGIRGGVVPSWEPAVPVCMSHLMGSCGRFWLQPCVDKVG